MINIVWRKEVYGIMSHTTILLREDIDSLGGRGEVVKVKAGYARNYLLPQGLATVATKGNVKQIEQERAALLRRAAVEKATAEAQREQMGEIALTFERKVGDHGTLFGSVTTMDIADALKEKGYEIDRRKIALRDAIKEIGEFKVSVKLHREVVLPLSVTVTAEGGEVAEPKAEKKGRKAKAAAEEATEAPAAETVEAPETEETAS
ncbi:MAG: 50S ribosomal protein L9 [Pyrinomonadaceae bacterium]